MSFGFILGMNSLSEWTVYGRDAFRHSRSYIEPACRQVFLMT